MPLVTLQMSTKMALEKAGIDLKEFYPEDCSPYILLQVDYHGEDVTLGNALSAEQTTQPPTVSFIPIDDDDAQYTLLMVDLDAPSSENRRNSPWRHWVVSNIRPNGAAQVTPCGNDLTPYHPPKPPHGTGPHRYVFLLYKQNNNDQPFAAMSAAPVDRQRFNVAAFVQTNQLKLVGVNFFYSSTPNST